jgi:hypothetical protein
LGGRQLDGEELWSAEIEHHLALVAARNLMLALDLDPASRVSIDPILRDELFEGRNLHEHWDENMPVFNVTPRVRQPRYPSGRSFAARNPREGAYMALDWGNQTGARLLPHDAGRVRAAARTVAVASRERRMVAEAPDN